MSPWIPALLAGMTELRSRSETDPGPPPHVFSKERRRNYSLPQTLKAGKPLWKILNLGAEDSEVARMRDC